MRRKTLTIILTCLIILLATACGNEKKQEKATQKAPEPQQEQTETRQAQEGTEEVEKQGKEETAESKALAVYFSRVGNTEFPEDIDVISSASLNTEAATLKGNAQLIAEYIAEEAGCDTFEIVTRDPYPVDYNETVDQARDEQSEEKRPELKNTLENLDIYDTIYLVMPNWWGDLPMPVYSFLDQYDLTGKTVNVFVTHEGSGFSGIVDTVRKLEPEAKFNEALAISGSSVSDEEENVRNWVKENN
ncbi:MAG: hypothetical protein IJH71_08925 [Eubacterium sp.]|nr:hypothetical protein [Eubacterium sp.]